MVYSDTQLKNCIDIFETHGSPQNDKLLHLGITEEHISILETAWRQISTTPTTTIKDLQRAGMTFYSIDMLLGGINHFKKLMGLGITDTQTPLDYESLLLSIATDMQQKAIQVIPSWKELPHQRALRKCFPDKIILCRELNRIAKQHSLGVDEFIVGKGCTPIKTATVTLPPELSHLPTPTNEQELQPIAIEYFCSLGYKIHAINAIGIDFEVIASHSDKIIYIELKMYSADFDKRLEDVDGLLCLHDNMNATMKAEFANASKPVVSLAKWLEEL